MRFGVFLAPFHPEDECPTEQIHRDLELVEHLERFGYDEVWIGEHHSGGVEIVASPELFIAHAAARTARIRLGTGVSALEAATAEHEKERRQRGGKGTSWVDE
jgi:limonene 1,2-monooxygenase